MKKLAFVAVMSITVAWADSPADYSSRAELASVSQTADALHRVVLPFEAYREAKPDFSDLRMFNGAGEALPFAFTSEHEAVKTVAPSIALSIFPVAAPPPSKGKSADPFDIVVQSGGGGTIVSVQGRAGGTTVAKPVMWLLDATQLTTAISALDIDWDMAAGTEIVRVNVDASEDLKEWRRVSSQSQLVHLEQAGTKLEQRRVELGSLKSKYLRVTSDTAGFALKGVQALPVATVQPVPRSMRPYTTTKGAKPGEFEIDVGARLPLEAMRVVLPPNTIAPFAIATREDASGAWIPLTSATFYRLSREGATIESAPLEFPRRSARFVQLTLDPRSPGLGADSLIAEVQWRPAEIVYVARGAGPYTMAFGNREAQRTILALNQLIPDYKPGAETKIEADSVKDVTTIVRTRSAMESLVGEVNGRKLVLWAVLLAAVAMLGWMAWKLGRPKS